MVYRSFGLVDSQDSIARRLGPPKTCTPTYRLAADAIERGLAALVLQAHGDWLAVGRALDGAARCIVNHRLTERDRAGHFSVLTDCQAGVVHLLDPLYGPRQLRTDAFLRLWSATSNAIPGQVLVVVARRGQTTLPCTLCGTALPARLRCRRCPGEIPLQPSAVLGCMTAGCPMRSWSTIFCPWCDRRISGVDR
jgi:hypothetical protein